ncbi:unnamed protein product [Angiostrongylus costaricensis]|uniref:MFS domain-containing protein n=1 Tax=Angiostrongylus costaricensis TaxID=334426 RepID=A0A158PG66_ANGCS|nr:unnamed protein product [Angiostrongylus costaricensis]
MNDDEEEANKRLRASSALLPPDDRIRSSTLMLKYMQLDADKVLSAYGRFGRYQMVTYLITNSVHILFAINMMVMPFITEDPEFECQITPPDGVQWEYTIVDKCTVMDSNNWTLSCSNVPGSKYIYNDTNHESLASEFNLVCDNYESVEHGASVFMLGGMIVAPIITQLSDLFGRRLTFLIPLYVAVISNLICAVAPNYVIFLIFRFFAGVATTGFSVIGFVLCMESVALEFRSLIPFMGSITWVIGMIPESLHWLITNKKDKDISSVVMNGTYWALSLFSTELSDDKMTGFFLSGLVELPAGLVSIVLLIYLDRKTVSFLSLVLQAFSMVCALYLPLSKKTAMIFPLMAKIFNSIAWSSQPLLYTESTPTSVRNVFCGVAGFFGDFGSVLAPYLKRLETIHKSAPALVIAAMSVTSALIVLVLPETKDKKLPEDIDDLDPGPLVRWMTKNKKKKKNDSQNDDISAMKMTAASKGESASEKVTFEA